MNIYMYFVSIVESSVWRLHNEHYNVQVLKHDKKTNYMGVEEWVFFLLGMELEIYIAFKTMKVTNYKQILTSYCAIGNRLFGG